MKNLTLLRSILTGTTPSYGTVLLGIAIKEFGIECLEWEPETLELEFTDTYKVKLSSVVKNQLNAIITMLTSDLWERDPVVFNHVANSLGDGAVSMDSFEPASPSEMAWALTEYTILDRPEPMDPENTSIENKLSDDVKAYIGYVLKNTGVRPNGIFAFLKDKYDFNYAAWAEDPLLTQAMYTSTEDNYKAVEEYVQHNLKQLTEQLRELELRAPAKEE